MNTRLNDRIHRTRLFTEAAVNAFEQVYVVPCRAPGTVFSNVGLNRNCKSRANGFAQLARNTTFFTIRVTPLRVQTTKSWRLRIVTAGLKKLKNVTDSPCHNSQSVKVLM
jgi:hypothetical protein